MWSPPENRRTMSDRANIIPPPDRMSDFASRTSAPCDQLAEIQVELDVDHATRGLLAELRARQLLPADHMSTEYLRGLDEFLVEVNGDGPTMYAVHDVDDEMSPFRLFQPIADPIGVVVFFGGGWAPGVVRHLEPVLRKLAERTSCVFAAIDAGRLWATPTAERLDRTVAAFDAAATCAATLVHRGAPLIVAGEGPGAWCATICAEAAPALAQEIALQVLVCPLLSGETDDAAGGELMLSPSAVSEFWSGREPSWSPLDTPVQRPVPTTLVLTAGYDVLKGQGARYVARLRETCVAVIHEDCPQQIHGFVDMLSLPHGELAFQRIIRAVRTIAVPRMPSAAPREARNHDLD
jgi:acetyl esterase